MRPIARFARIALIPALALAAAGLASLPAPGHAQQSTPQADGPFNAEEQREIGRLVREYLLEHPEVIMEAVEVLRAREQQAQERSRKDALVQHAEALNDPGPLQVLGNPDGDVTIVEFFDYRCPYCRSVTDPLLQTVREDGNVRLVMKEYPILGQASVFAARAAIAASMQGKYEAFHAKLMTEVQQVDQDSVLKLAETLDLDVDRLREDMQSETVDKELQRTFRLAEALQIGGTPAFVIGEEMVPGALGMDRLRQLIAKARQAGE